MSKKKSYKKYRAHTPDTSAVLTAKSLSISFSNPVIAAALSTPKQKLS